MSRPSRKGGAAAGTLFLLLGAVPLGSFVALDLWPDHAIGGSSLLANVAAVALALYMTMSAWRAVRHPDACPNTSAAWRWIGLGATLNLGAEIAWIEAENLFGYADIPFSVHVLYLLAYGPFLAGLIALPPQLRTKSDRIRFWLDACAVLVGGTMLVFATVIYPGLQTAGTSLQEQFLAIAYPVGDLLLLLGVTTVLLRQPAPMQRPVYTLLLLGLGIWFMGDLGFSYLTIQNLYEGGSLLDLLWVTGYWLVGEAARVQVQGDRLERLRQHPDEHALKRFSLLPYAGVAVGYGVLAVHALHTPDPLLTCLALGAVLLTCIVIARQVFAMRENARLAAETEAKRVDERYRALVHNSSDLISVLDADGAIRFLSPSALPLTGYDPLDVVGARALDFLVQEDAAAAREVFRQALEGQPQRGVQLRLRRRDGREVVLEIVITNALEDTLVEGVIVNARDITERVSVEHRLRETQKMEAVGRVAGGIAHDFNNLLTAIQGNALLLLDDVARNDPRRSELEEIGKASEVAAGLTRQLLAFSRQQVVQPRIIRPDENVREVERMLSRMIREDIRVDLRLQAPGVVVELDPTELEQILLNLVLNARDAIAGSGRITIASAVREISAADSPACAAARTGSWYVLSVADTGSGIPEPLRARIFEPFFTTKSPGSGTGLGLATVKEIVERAGGWIVLESERGVGTTFSVGLPMASITPAQAPLVPPATIPIPAAVERPAILLVDDEPAVSSFAQRVLERAGFIVCAASSGEEALELAAHMHRLDLLVSDMLMPGITGLELATRLRQQRPELPVLLMSGYSDDDITEAHALDDATRFLQKPFPPSQLAGLASELLGAVRAN